MEKCVCCKREKTQDEFFIEMTEGVMLCEDCIDLAKNMFQFYKKEAKKAKIIPLLTRKKKLSCN